MRLFTTVLHSFKKLCVHSQKFCALPRNFLFVCKSFAFPSKLCIHSQVSWRNTKLLQANTSEVFGGNVKILQANWKKFLWKKQMLCEQTQYFWEGGVQMYCKWMQSFSAPHKSFSSKHKVFRHSQNFCMQTQRFCGDHKGFAWENAKALRYHLSFFLILFHHHFP